MRISNGILNIIPVVLKMSVHDPRNHTYGDMTIMSNVEESHCHVGLV